MLHTTSGYICETHSNPAQAYCNCMGTKQYLCEDCLSKHMKLNRQHIIVQIGSDILGLDDVERLNRKAQVRETLRQTLQELMEKIEGERRGVVEYLSKYQAYHIGQLQCAYGNLQNHSNAVYDLYARMCCEMWEELGNCRGVLSTQTALFVDFAAHISASTVPFFIPIEKCLGKSIKLAIESLPEMPTVPFSNLLQTWGKSTKCECEQCEDYRDLFELPPQTPWFCYNCRTENKGLQECSACHCGREWADYLTYEDVKLSEDRKKWICQKCSCKNGLHEGICCKCRNPCTAIQRGLSTLPTLVQRFLYRS